MQGLNKNLNESVKLQKVYESVLVTSARQSATAGDKATWCLHCHQITIPVSVVTRASTAGPCDRIDLAAC